MGLRPTALPGEGLGGGEATGGGPAPKVSKDGRGGAGGPLPSTGHVGAKPVGAAGAVCQEVFECLDLPLPLPLGTKRSFCSGVAWKQSMAGCPIFLQRAHR